MVVVWRTHRGEVGASDLHGMEWGTSGDLELVCNEAVQSRGRGPGFHE